MALNKKTVISLKVAKYSQLEATVILLANRYGKFGQKKVELTEGIFVIVI